MITSLNNTEIEHLLKSSLVGRIGCCSNHTPYVVPISFAYEEDNVYCYTHEGLKLEMMRNNPSVCFQVDAMPTMAEWKSVIAWGEFEELTDALPRNHALRMLMDRVLPVESSETTHISPFWPFPSNPASIEGVVFRIKLHRKTGRCEKRQLGHFVLQG